MADKLFKVDEAIEFGYQAPNKESGLIVVAEVYLPNKAKDSTYPDITVGEIGTSGTYRGSFVPNVEGTWQVIIHKDDGDGQVSKSFSVGSHNVHSVGDAIALVSSDVAGVDDAVADIDVKVDAVDTKVTAIQNQVDTLGAPPMAF
jgi:hypothetical protein